MEQIENQRAMLDQIKTFERIVSLCSLYDIDIKTTQKTLQNGELWISIEANVFKSDIYDDGADIYSNAIDLRYEIYDYNDKNELFRQFMKDFFDLVINV